MTPIRLATATCLLLLTAMRTSGQALDAHGDPLPAGALARLGTVRLRHSESIADQALSPDGTLLASCTGFSDHAIRVWETATGKRVLDRPGPEGVNVMAMAFTPDSKMLALAGQTFNNDRAHIDLWDVPGGKTIRRIPIPVNRVPFAWLASFSPDGKLLAVGCDRIHVLDPATGTLRHSLATGKNHTTALAFTPDGKLLLTADEDGTLAVWDPHTGKRLHTLATDLIYTLAVRHDGQLVAGAGPGRPVRLWRVKRGPGDSTRLTPHDPPPGHEEGANVLAFSRDGKLLAAGAAKGGLWLWDSFAAKTLRERPWAEVEAHAAGFDPGGRPLVVGSTYHAESLQILDVATGKPLLDGPAHPRSIQQLWFSPEGKTLASLCHGGVLHLWRAADGKHLGQPAVPGGAIRQAAFTADGKLLLVAGQTLYRLDPPGGRVMPLPRAWPPSEGWTLSEDGVRVVLQQLATPDRRRLAARSSAQVEPTLWRFSLWDIVDGKELCKLPFRPHVWTHVPLAPDGTVMATVGEEITLWHATGRRLCRLPVKAHVRGLGFSPTGRLVAVRERAAVSLWEVASGRMLRRWAADGEQRGFSHPFESLVVFSRDGRILATDAFQGAIKCWDVGTGRLLHTLPGDGRPVTALAFAPDGKTLAVGHADTTVLLWDIRRVRPLPLPTDSP